MSLLAGCRLDVGVAIAVSGDGAGTVTVTARADPELLTKAPSALTELRIDDVRQAGWNVTGPTRAADGSAMLVLAKAFRTPSEAGAVLAELNGPGGPFHGLTLTTDHRFAVTGYALSGDARLDGGIETLSDAALIATLEGKVPLAELAPADLADGLSVSLTASAPGTVTTTTGTVAAGSVSWTPDLHAKANTALLARWELTDQRALDARSHARIARRVAAIFAIVVGVLIVAVGGTLMVRRRHR